MYDNVPKITFGDLKTEIKDLIWPNGVPENLVKPIDVSFEDALVDLQTYVDCLQAWHTDVYPQCSTYFQCGLTVFDKPRGKILRIRAFQGDFCDPVTLNPTTMHYLKCWSRRFMERVTAPANTGMPALPMGFKFADATTDSQWGRALLGLWSMERDRIYVAPHIQSLESIVVEWDGLKRTFSDSDLWPNDRDFKRTLKLWVQSEFSRDFERDFGAKQQFKVDYLDARADLMFRCAEERRLPPPEPCESEREYLWSRRILDDEPDTAEKSTVVALFGDYGTCGSEAAIDVATLVKSWNVNGIVTLGDNNYQGGGSCGYDESVGAIYRSFMFPYSGSSALWTGETAATENKFWPSLGNHDNDVLQEYLDYFSAITPGNDRFYDVVIGPIHFFVINSGLDTAGNLTENAGNDALSVQAAWFRDRVATSQARWKVAVLHHPPYSSYRYPGTTSLRWVKGVDLVISAHNHHYERLEINDQIYLIAGTGGAPLYEFDDQVIAGSLVRYDENHGALRLTATCDALKAEFITIDGDVIDTVEIGEEVDTGGGGGGPVSPPEPPTLPPATFQLINAKDFDPRDPLVLPGDATHWPNGNPAVWSIWLQTLPGEPSVTLNQWYWSPVLQNYI